MNCITIYSNVFPHRQQGPAAGWHGGRSDQLPDGHMQAEAQEQRRHNIAFHARERRTRTDDHRLREHPGPAAAVHRGGRHQCLWQTVRGGRHHGGRVPTEGRHAVRVQELVPRAGGVPEAEAGGALGADVAQQGRCVFRVASEYCLRITLHDIGCQYIYNYIYLYRLLIVFVEKSTPIVTLDVDFRFLALHHRLRANAVKQ